MQHVMSCGEGVIKSGCVEGLPEHVVVFIEDELGCMPGPDYATKGHIKFRFENHTYSASKQPSLEWSEGPVEHMDCFGFYFVAQTCHMNDIKDF